MELNKSMRKVFHLEKKPSKSTDRRPKSILGRLFSRDPRKSEIAPQETSLKPDRRFESKRGALSKNLSTENFDNSAYASGPVVDSTTTGTNCGRVVGDDQDVLRRTYTGNKTRSCDSPRTDPSCITSNTNTNFSDTATPSSSAGCSYVNGNKIRDSTISSVNNTTTTTTTTTTQSPRNKYVKHKDANIGTRQDNDQANSSSKSPLSPLTSSSKAQRRRSPHNILNKMTGPTEQRPGMSVHCTAIPQEPPASEDITPINTNTYSSSSPTSFRQGCVDEEDLGNYRIPRSTLGSSYQGEYIELCIDGWTEDDCVEAEENVENGASMDDSDEDEVDGKFMPWNAKCRKHRPEISKPISHFNEHRAEGQKQKCEERPKPKYQRVAIEIFTTEVTYVRRLTMLMELHDELLKSKALTEKVVTAMFPKLLELHLLHSDTLLPQLQQTIHTWPKEPEIGALMKKSSKNFMIYIPFVTSIESTRTMMLGFKRKGSSKAGSVIADFENAEAAGRIPLLDFLMEPMTRLLRYKLLLGEYLRLLPVEHQDRTETIEALDRISEIARDVNESMRAKDNMKQTKLVQDHLKDPLDLVDPARTFLKEGRLAMICPLADRHLERHLFLFNDLLLICQPPSLGVKYKLQKRLSLRGMKVERGDESQFTLLNRNAVIDFLGSTPSEANEWILDIQNAIQRNKDSMADDEVDVDLILEDELGYQAPRLARRSECKKCRQCGLEFTFVRRPKNHCYACGQMFCPSCTKRDLPLAYNDGQLQRVCDRCFSALQFDAVCNSCEDLPREEWKMGEFIKTSTSFQRH